MDNTYNYGGYSGNNALKIRYDSNNFAQERTVAKTKKISKVKKTPVLTFKRIIGALVFFASLLAIVNGYVRINEMNAALAAKNKQLSEIQVVNEGLRAKIESTISDQELQAIATQKYGMIKPERYQIFYVDMQLPDSGEKENKVFNTKVAVSSVPGTLINAIKGFK